MDPAPPPDADRDTIGPLPLRIGLFTAIVLGVVLAALGVSALYSRFADSEAAPTSTDQTTDLGSNGAAARLAPNFTVELLDGTTFDLDRHLAEDGRPVILNFWASWCTPCRVEMPDFDEIAREKPGLKVIGVAVSDTEQDAREFAAEVGVSYALGIDTSETVAAAYPFLGLPSTWFIDSGGLIVREFAGQVDAEALRGFISGDFGF